jgi:hypothetical protein
MCPGINLKGVNLRMKWYLYPHSFLLFLVGLSFAIVLKSPGEGLGLTTDGKGRAIINSDQTSDLPSLTNLPAKLISLANESGFEINTAEDGDVIFDNNKTLDLQAGGKDVTVTGNGNTIHIHGDLLHLALIGRANVVELDRVGSIALVGADNQVTYLGGLNSNQPSIDRVGKDNRVTKRETQDGPQPSPTVTPSANVSPNPTMVIEGSNQQRADTVNSDQVTISGSNNQITLKGQVKDLLIEGSNNDIKTDDLGHVTFAGSNNLVEYGSSIEANVRSNIRGGTNNDVRRR